MTIHDLMIEMARLSKVERLRLAQMLINSVVEDEILTDTPDTDPHPYHALSGTPIVTALIQVDQRSITPPLGNQ